MEALFHFAFELVKISILGSVYATLILLISYFFSRQYSNTRVWWISGLIVSVGLFLFMLSYWGDHGLGDFARIPIGHGKDIKQIDCSSTYIENSGGEQLSIDHFLVSNGFLYAKVDTNRFREKTGYVVWRLKSDTWDKYTDAQYIALIKEKNYPSPERFREFGTAYSDYWNGWRFFLLP